MKFLLIAFTLFFNTSTYSQALETYDHTINYLRNPIGIDDETPEFSWKIKGPGQNLMQSSFEIQVSATADFKNLAWSTGKVQSDQSIHISYQGDKLLSRHRYYWRVRIKDNKGNLSEWSQNSFFEMGFLNLEDWKAQWIEPVQDSIPNGPSLYVRKEIRLKKEIKRARAYVSAHGLYELSINGKLAGNQLFTPGWTAYQKRLQYQVYDITDLLQEGKNAIATVLGDGWWRGNIASPGNWGFYGKKIGLICQLEVTYIDGSTEVFISDKSWKGTNNGPILLNSIYNGENYDARKEMVGWNLVGFSDKNWNKVIEADYSLDNLIASESIPVRKIERIEPVKIWRTPKGTLIADMGQNMVGWVRLKVKGSAGTKVVMRYAEVLDKHGEFYTANLRTARATTEYTLKGGAVEVYEPKFTFMGFRYVAIDGFPGELREENLTGIVIHSDMKETGSFECSNPLINQLQSNIRWGQKGNFLDVPTDCPQRDERLGWTGDAQVFVSTAAYNMNVAGFFTKWLKDLTAEQTEEGSVPVIIPNVTHSKTTCSGWGDAATIVPWTIYQSYGNIRVLEEQYSSMKKYVDYMTKQDEIGWKGFGDWLFFKPEMTQHSIPDGHTNPDIIINAFNAYSAKLVSLAATELGYKVDAEHYRNLYEKLKKDFNFNFVTPSGRISSDSQTSYVLALMFDLLPDNVKKSAVNHLVNNIRSRNNHLSTGFLGTPYLCKVLSDNGKTDVAYDLLLQESFPSWLYPVKMGATTIWERWDGQKPDSTFQDVSMNSFNHYAYGAVGKWLYSVVGGINAGSPGYKEIVISPKPDARLDYVKTSLESAYGNIKSEWRIENGYLQIKTSVPPNTTAQIILPEISLAMLKSANPTLSELLQKAHESDGNVILKVGSGKYEFKYNSGVTAGHD